MTSGTEEVEERGNTDPATGLGKYEAGDVRHERETWRGDNVENGNQEERGKETMERINERTGARSACKSQAGGITETTAPWGRERGICTTENVSRVEDVMMRAI